MQTVIESPAGQVIVSLIPIIGIVIGGIVVFFYLLWHHREISLLIKTGNYKPDSFNLRLFSLFSGLLLTAIGIMLTVLFILLEGLSYTLLGGLIPLCLGVALLVFFGVYPTILKTKSI